MQLGVKFPYYFDAVLSISLQLIKINDKKFPTIIVLLSISLFMFVNIALGIYVLLCWCISFMDYSLVMVKGLA